MLTLFRKIRRSLIKSGRAEKYLLYAIGEIALVVIGILIALQINNWNEDRNERSKERIVLSELGQNIELNIAKMKDQREWLERGEELGDVIISQMEFKLSYHDSLDLLFASALRNGGTLNLIESAYEIYKNVGFDIVVNQDLKKEIINLYEIEYDQMKVAHDVWKSGEMTEQRFIDEHFLFQYWR